jgi:hypothetical protein
MMEKLDKVIAGLECCGEANEIVNVCLEGCPYYGERDGDKVCMDMLMEDALDLLKELSSDNQRLREMWADAVRELSVVRAERDFAVGLAKAYGDFVEATLEKEAENE